jgi:hypothetical protein
MRASGSIRPGSPSWGRSRCPPQSARGLHCQAGCGKFAGRGLSSGSSCQSATVRTPMSRCLAKRYCSSAARPAARTRCARSSRSPRPWPASRRPGGNDGANATPGAGARQTRTRAGATQNPPHLAGHIAIGCCPFPLVARQFFSVASPPHRESTRNG